MTITASNARSNRPALAPFLRWAGSKRQLIPELMKYVPEHFERYIEPFSGSACLFFTLRPERAVIADMNQELIHAYSELKAHPKLIHRAVAAMPKGTRFYYTLRNQQTPELNPIDRAARFIYLNRYCFNGVYRTNRAGQFNVPRGKRVGELPAASQFIRCSIALRKAKLIGGDFEEVLKCAVKGDFVYLDPPYAKRGSRRRGEYGYSSFDIPDLDRLARSLHELEGRGAMFLLSYAYCQEIREIAKQWNTKRLQVRRHVAGFHQHRGIVQEILISNLNLKFLKAPK